MTEEIKNPQKEFPKLTQQQADKLISLKDEFNYLTFDDLNNDEVIEKHSM